MKKFLFLVILFCWMSPLLYADLVVTDFGAAGDGETDCTQAFQAALDEAAKTGTTVRVPAGQFRIEGNLVVPPDVTLEGTWPGQHTAHLDKGSTLLAFAGRGEEEGTPFIQLFTASTLKGVTIFYPEQVLPDIQPYPWTIQGRGQHYGVQDCVLVNSYNGIDCGTFHNEGHYLRNVLMCALKTGVYVDNCTDIGRQENVHIHPVYWWRVSAPYNLSSEQTAALNEFTLEHLTGFKIGRTDWEYMTNCFVFIPRIGFHFGRFLTSAGNAMLTQCGSDAGPTAVLVEDCQAHAGISFSNVQMYGDIIVSSSNTGPVRFTGSGLFGSPEGHSGVSHALIAGDGQVSFGNCHFKTINGANRAQTMIRLHQRGGLTMTGCDILEPGKEHLVIEPGSRNALLTGNRFAGSMNIVNRSRKANVLVESNLEDIPPEEPEAIVIDDSEGEPAFRTEGDWYGGLGGRDYLGGTMWTYVGQGEVKAYWTPDIPASGKYQVFIWYGADPRQTHATDQKFIVSYKGGRKEFEINMRKNVGQWNRLGEFEFEKGRQGYVMTSNAANAHVNADAVKFVPVE